LLTNPDFKNVLRRWIDNKGIYPRYIKLKHRPCGYWIVKKSGNYNDYTKYVTNDGREMPSVYNESELDYYLSKPTIYALREFYPEKSH
jgi:hypothetical protein